MKIERFAEKTLKVVLSAKQKTALMCQALQMNLAGLEGSGKSFVTYIVIIYSALSRRTSIFYVCPTQRQTMDKKEALSALIEQAGLACNLTRSIEGLMQFKNGSRIHFISAEQKNSSIKGFHSQFGKEKSGAVIVLLDDATSIREDFSDAILASLFTASSWRLLLCYNVTDTSSWCYPHHLAGLRKDPDIKTFSFQPSDNPRVNPTASAHFLKVNREHYGYRFSGGWDKSKFDAFPADLLHSAIDDNHSLNLKPQAGYSYMMGADLNDPMGGSVGRDRDSAVFMTVGKKIENEKCIYRVAGVEFFQVATVSEWFEGIKRQMRLFPIDKILIESPHSSGLLELMKRDGIGDRVQLCNPHQKSDTFSLTAGYSYLSQCLQGKLLRIPHDADALLKEMRELRVEMTDSHEIRFYHRKHHHNDNIVALLWALLGLRELESTGTVNYSEILYGMRHSRTRPSIYGGLDTNRYDREFLELPSKRDIDNGFF